ncbi:MAG: hypothetical protein AB8B85_23885 [Paracoccaceae bacterium]
MAPSLRPANVLRQRLRAGHYAEVRDEVRQHGAKGVEYQKCLCDALAQLRDWSGAIAVAELHLGQDPYFSPVLLAKFHNNTGNYAEGWRWLDEARKADGETIGWLITASKAAFFQNDVLCAIKFGQRALDEKDKALGTPVPITLIEGGSKKILSFSLFGTGEIYLMGALANARLWVQMVPDWTCRFYLAPDVPEGIGKALQQLGAETILQSDPKIPAYLARFLPLQDPQVARFACRDVDCRPTAREVDILREWEKTAHAFHLIRNSPLHTDLVLAGLWGGMPIEGFDLKTEIAACFPKGASNKYGLDQRFLEHRIWARIRSSLLTHDQHYRLTGIETRPVDDPDLGGGHQDIKAVRRELAELRINLSIRRGT